MQNKEAKTSGEAIIRKNSKNEKSLNAYFKVKKTSDEQYMFVLKAGNNETILASERYKTIAGALNGIKSVQENSQILSRFENRVSDAQQPHYFVLKAKNGEIIGLSENYPTAQIRDKGINSVHKNGCTIRIKDTIKDVEITCLEIQVNGRRKEWAKATITFEELVILAFGSIVDSASRCYTVTYSKPRNTENKGVLVDGDKVDVKPNMIFNVTATDKS